MSKNQSQTKRVLIDKANTTMVVVVAIASFLVVFSFFGSKALLSQRAYYSRVISSKQKAVNQLKINITVAKQLDQSYASFVDSPTNILGGNPKGSGARDGDNARLVLDALPSKYDFPALATSLEKLIFDLNLKIGGITGSDDEIAQSDNSQSTTNLVPIEIPFEVAVSGTYAGTNSLIGVFEKSIRPFHIQSINLSGSDANLQLSIKAKTYFQPQKSLAIKTEVIK